MSCGRVVLLPYLHICTAIANVILVVYYISNSYGKQVYYEQILSACVYTE